MYFTGTIYSKQNSEKVGLQATGLKLSLFQSTFHSCNVYLGYQSKHRKFHTDLDLDFLTELLFGIILLDLREEQRCNETLGVRKPDRSRGPRLFLVRGHSDKCKYFNLNPFDNHSISHARTSLAAIKLARKIRHY